MEAACGRGEGQGGEVVPLLTEHVGGVLNEDPDDHGAEEAGHGGGARPVIEVRTVVLHPVLNARLERGEEVHTHGAGGLLAAHRFTDHQADEVLDLEHGGHDLGQELGQRHGLGGRALALGVDVHRPDREEPLLNQHRLQEVALAREVVVQRGHVEARRRGQVPHARPVDAALGHQGEGDLQDPAPSRRPLSGAGCCSLCMGVTFGGRANAHLRSHSPLSELGTTSRSPRVPCWLVASSPSSPVLPCPGRIRYNQKRHCLHREPLFWTPQRSFAIHDMGVRSEPRVTPGI